MTKTKVLALAKKQNARVEIGMTSDGFEVYIALPGNLIWDNNYYSGTCVQILQDGETMADFWTSIYDYINHDVIHAPSGCKDTCCNN
jgi:hypothetical protein